jgi:hypothetical protein
MKIKIFDSYADFYNFIEAFEMINLSPVFSEFATHYNNINVGCGCSRKARVQTAVDSYRDTVALLQVDGDLLNQLKTGAQYSEIQMYHEGNLIFKG